MNQATLFTGRLETREDALQLVDQWMYATDWKTLEDHRNRLAELILEVRRWAAASIADDIEGSAPVVPVEAAMALRTSAALIRSRYGITPEYYELAAPPAADLRGPGGER